MGGRWEKLSAKSEAIMASVNRLGLCTARAVADDLSWTVEEVSARLTNLVCYKRIACVGTVAQADAAGIAYEKGAPTHSRTRIRIDARVFGPKGSQVIPAYVSDEEERVVPRVPVSKGGQVAGPITIGKGFRWGWGVL